MVILLIMVIFDMMICCVFSSNISIMPMLVAILRTWIVVELTFPFVSFAAIVMLYIPCWVKLVNIVLNVIELALVRLNIRILSFGKIIFTVTPKSATVSLAFTVIFRMLVMLKVLALLGLRRIRFGTLPS